MYWLTGESGTLGRTGIYPVFVVNWIHSPAMARTPAAFHLSRFLSRRRGRIIDSLVMTKVPPRTAPVDLPCPEGDVDEMLFRS
jgi:hypothetical protein